MQSPLVNWHFHEITEQSIVVDLLFGNWSVPLSVYDDMSKYWDDQNKIIGLSIQLCKKWENPSPTHIKLVYI